MTTIKVFGDSRLNSLAQYVNLYNNTTANVEIIPRGGATISSTASEVWEHTLKHRDDIIFFLSGVNDITAWDDVFHKYILVHYYAENLGDNLTGAIQEFELNYHARFPTRPNNIWPNNRVRSVSLSPHLRP